MKGIEGNQCFQSVACATGEIGVVPDTTGSNLTWCFNLPSIVKDPSLIAF